MFRAIGRFIVEFVGTAAACLVGIGLALYLYLFVLP
jgi:hypothetical protein